MRVTRFGMAGFEIHGHPEGSVMTVEFDLCWEKLSEGGVSASENRSVRSLPCWA